MYCSKCGKKLPDGVKKCDCNEGEYRGQSSNQNENAGKGLFITIIAAIGAMCSIPFLAIEMNHYSYRGASRALEIIMEQNPWLMPAVFVSVIVLIIGLQKMFGKK